jgi:hypothetical protein
LVVVAPSETVATTGDISLSWYDKLFGDFAGTVLFVFEHAIQEPVETIKRGLSQALVHYYPMAGRFGTGAAAAAGEVVIRCTGEGVGFVAASANCTIRDVQALPDPLLQRELAIFYPATDGRCSEVDPLVLMQVTVFSCGGFVLGVTWSHAVADGVGIAQFVQAVGELARGLPSPSIVPVRQDDSVLLGRQPRSSTNSSQPAIGRRLQLTQAAELDITVKPSLINRMRDRYASMNSGRPCTVFEAVAAVLWRCRTRAIRSGPDAAVVLTFGANVRELVGAKPGYYGNCVMPRLVTASSGTVGNGDVMDLVKVVQGAKNGDQPEVDEHLQIEWYNILSITSWRNIGLEAPDFGGGKPARVKCHVRDAPLPICIACIPCSDEYNVLFVSVKEDHANAFLHELADMHLRFI